jgi:uncharacterized protein YggE
VPILYAFRPRGQRLPKMNGKHALAALAFLTGTVVFAQQASQPQLKIDSSNRVITVSAEEIVSVEPDLAIVHIGFESKVADAKAAYADGSRTSNAIVAALKQTGLPDTDIRSESQRLEPVDPKNHKFKLVQTWTVKTPPERAAEILDAAISAGATDSGDIDWTVQDIHALEDTALDRATTRVRSDAAVMAKAGGAKLGSLLFVTNQVSELGARSRANEAYTAQLDFGANKMRAAAPPIAVEPRKVSRTASVYAVFAIE